MSPEDDPRVQQELRRTDDLPAHALRLTPAAGIRIGEGMDRALDCLGPVDLDQWARHVPIGQLHTERLVPADPDVRQWVARILALRAPVPPAHWANSQGLLLPRSTGTLPLLQMLLGALVSRCR
jgi:hypothetical protein